MTSSQPTAGYAHTLRWCWRMLSLHEQEAKSAREQEMRQRQIEMTDAAIDRLVYRLYGLTEEEIKIVEGKNV